MRMDGGHGGGGRCRGGNHVRGEADDQLGSQPPHLDSTAKKTCFSLCTSGRATERTEGVGRGEIWCQVGGQTECIGAPRCLTQAPQPSNSASISCSYSQQKRQKQERRGAGMGIGHSGGCEEEGYKTGGDLSVLELPSASLANSPLIFC